MQVPSFVTDWPGKSATNQSALPHPAVYHMLDVAAVADQVIDGERFSQPLRDAIVVLTSLHDLGKIGAAFRDMLLSGRPQTNGRHWEVTEALLRNHDALVAKHLGGTDVVRRILYASVAGHHGRPPIREQKEMRRCLLSVGPGGLQDSEDALKALLQLWPTASLQELDTAAAKTLSWWLPGFISTCDWIGSNTEWFPSHEPTVSCQVYLTKTRDRAVEAVKAIGLVTPSVSSDKLFEFALRPMQQAAEETPLAPGPILALIEDETGSGKTEVALILAQRMLRAGKGRGLFFALPTTATANAMFERARNVIGSMFTAPPSLTLAHGRSALSQSFVELQSAEVQSDDVVCSEWLGDDRRKSLLGTVGVGTIDQALLSVLPTRFSTLRHYALASKILIIDEAHELGEPYLQTELLRLLEFHRRAGGSAIVLSATLPLDLRKAIREVYGLERDEDLSYPSLSIGAVPKPAIQARKSERGPVSIKRLCAADDAVALLLSKASDGAACVWVRNSVDDAIVAYEQLQALGADVDLFHARFALVDRLSKETQALTRFGKAGAERAGRILVATQVVESSLDLDFDVMVSDLAPMASLIQRAGRLWRHMDLRPRAGRPVLSPELAVLAPDPSMVANDRWLSEALGSGAYVYPLDTQWRTARVLFDAGEIDTPAGLRNLVEAVHGTDVEPVPDALLGAEIESIGAGFAARSTARQNLIPMDAEFRVGARASDDRDYPTRLGQEQRKLVLAEESEGGLRLWQKVDSCQLAEVQASEYRLSKLALPSQETHIIQAITNTWKDWQRQSLTVCPVLDDGLICDELAYSKETGLRFVAT